MTGMPRRVLAEGGWRVMPEPPTSRRETWERVTVTGREAPASGAGPSGAAVLVGRGEHEVHTWKYTSGAFDEEAGQKVTDAQAVDRSGAEPEEP